MVTGMDFVCLNCLSSLFVVFVFKIFHQFQGGGRRQICLLAFENSRVGVTWPPKLTTGTLCSGAKNHMGKKTDNLHFRGPIGVQAFTEAAISLLNSL